MCSIATMDVAETIKAIRVAKGIKQADLAKALGIEPNNYPKFEKRGNRLTVDNLSALSTALGVTVLDILTWGEEKSELSKSDAVLAQENEQLKKRVAELEDRVKDKEEIIQSKVTKVVGFRNYLSSNLHTLISDWAIENDIGKLNIEVYGRRKSTWPFTVRPSEMDKLIHDTQNDRNIRGRLCSYDIELTNEELDQAVKGVRLEFCTSLIKSFILEMLFLNTNDMRYFEAYKRVTGVVKDEDFWGHGAKLS